MIDQEKTESLLDENFLKRLEQIAIIGKKKAKSVEAGEHLSWKSGGSLEFQDYRSYQPGDDLRYVDWNVFGRLNRLVIKQFQAEKELAIHILIDASRSMNFGRQNKFLFAKKLAAALAYVSLMKQDRVGITAFNNSLFQSRSPEKGRLVYLSLVRFLDQLQVEDTTNLNRCLTDFVNKVRQPGYVIILSDFLDEAGYAQGLKALGYGRHEVMLLQILAEEELNPALQGYTKLEDLELKSKKTIPISQAIRRSYLKKLTAHQTLLKESCHERGFVYHQTSTIEPFETFILKVLTEGTIRI